MTQENLIKPYVIGLDLGGTNSVFGIVDSRAWGLLVCFASNAR